MSELFCVVYNPQFIKLFKFMIKSTCDLKFEPIRFPISSEISGNF